MSEFLELKQQLKDELNTFQECLLNPELLDLKTRYPEANYPWSEVSNTISDEEKTLYEPCMYTDILSSMQDGVEKLEADFEQQLNEHVSPDFQAYYDIINLLRQYKDVFIPYNWNGIDLQKLNMEPISPRVKSDLPTSLPRRTYFINPKKLANVKKELDRLDGYFLEKSDSPYSSPMVVAPKATDPFIRICGDFRVINKYIELSRAYIPNVLIELQKISKYSYFADIDMCNAFHQIPISKMFSDLLSMVTPWGARRPKFLPEGVNIAPGILQQVVQEIFKDFEEFMIVIFDNFLVLADSYEDLHKKLVLVLNRAREVNLQLKLKKTFLGWQTVKFFGYQVDGTTHSYTVDQDRVAKVDLIKRPTSLKEMQTLLGHGQAFIPHCKNYSMRVAPLTEMVKTKTNWKDPELWTQERIDSFEDYKVMIKNAFQIYFPNYEWDFVLVVDGSTWGCAGVLYQVNPETNIWEPLACVSHKFSDQAQKWSPIDQEAYANYWPVLQLQKYLLGKPFILYTDHFNLLYIEKSIVPRIKRMHAFLNGMQFLIAHIPGKLNVVADFWSRIFAPTSTTEEIELSTNYILPLLAAGGEDRIIELFNQVHNGSVGHFGARKTYAALNKNFPGHGIPYVIIADMVSNCGLCQKLRLRYNQQIDKIEAIPKSLLQEDFFDAIGMDAVEVSPTDIYGNNYVFVICILRSKLAFGHAAPTKDTIYAARTLFIFFSIYGVYRTIYTDPGSEFTSNLVRQLTNWFGVLHKFSIVDRHESNGTEGTNKQLLRHITMLVHEKRFSDRWGSPEILNIAFHIINEHASDETNISAYTQHFGSDAAQHFKLPNGITSEEEPEEYLKQLDADLRHLRQVSYEFMLKIKRERLGLDSETEKKYNSYQPGDLILFEDYVNNTFKPEKLSIPFKGPYEVTKHEGNSVFCKHINLGVAKEFHTDRVKIFHCNRNDPVQWQIALDIAKLDSDQFTISEIVSYRGNPFERKTTHFDVIFADGDRIWKNYDKDLSSSEPFYDFVFLNKRFPQLQPLVYQLKEANQIISDYNKILISVEHPEIAPDVTFYLDLRFFDTKCKKADWYFHLSLPDLHEKTYVFQCIYTSWGVNNNHKWITFRVLLTNTTYKFNTYSVRSWGWRLQLDPRYDVLVTKRLMNKYKLTLPINTNTDDESNAAT